MYRVYLQSEMVLLTEMKKVNFDTKAAKIDGFGFFSYIMQRVICANPSFSDIS